MGKILHATTRGQVTLPKSWRDKYATEYFVTEEGNGMLIIRPLLSEELHDSFKESVESLWKEYQETGESTPLEEVAQKYGL